MDAVALVVEQNFPELHSCFCGLQHTCFAIAARRDVSSMDTTSDALDGLRELAALQGLAVLERLPRACVERQRRDTAAALSCDV